MAVPLNKGLVRALIEQRFRSIDELVVEWEDRVARGRQRVGKSRDRSAIYRWIQQGLPSNRDDVLGFSAVLDVDPIAILGIDESFLDQYFAKERRRVLSGLDRRSPLTPFVPIYSPGPAWPNEEVAHSYYGRSWFAENFEHGPEKIANVYAAVHLVAVARGDSLVPRTYHFAYRRTGARDGMWRPYGTVIGYQKEVCLISESGDYQKISDDRSNEMVVAETYFGSGAAEFRIASLHNFSIRLEAPSQEKSAVRFQA